MATVGEVMVWASIGKKGILTSAWSQGRGKGDDLGWSIVWTNDYDGPAGTGQASPSHWCP